MSIAVIGTVFMDCKAFVGENYDPSGRNVGRISIVHGGVARNVAENLGRLGCDVHFMSGVDDSPLADAVLKRLNEDGVKTEYVMRGSSMGMWSVIADEKGKQLGSVSQLPDTSSVEKYFEMIGEELMQSFDLVAVEVDYSMDIFKRTLSLCKKHGKKAYGVIANLDVAGKVPELLPELELMICNDIEIGKLFKIKTAGLEPDELIEVLKPEMLKRGFRKLIVTVGAKGSVFVDVENAKEFVTPALPVKVVDAVGAGDAFFSGVVASLDKGLDIKKAVIAGTRLASLTIQQEDNTCIPTINIFE